MRKPFLAGWMLVVACFLIALITVALFWSRQTVAQVNHPTTEDSNIARLQQERLKALQHATAIATTLFKNGNVSFGALCDRTDKALEAELELAQTHQERLKILQSMLQNAQNAETYAQALSSEGGQGSYFDGDDAKAHRLEIEIAIAKEQSR